MFYETSLAKITELLQEFETLPVCEQRRVLGLLDATTTAIRKIKESPLNFRS